MLKNWLLEHGCEFNEDDFPVLPEGCFATTEPTYLAPWHHRNYYPKDKTSVCFCMPDEYIYPRFEKIFDEIEELKQYHSVCSLDLSVSKNMNHEMQAFNMLLNALYTAVLAYSGIKIIPSLRCGDEDTINLLLPYKGAPIWLLGIHGCSRSMDLSDYDEFILRCELMILWPEKLVLYGLPNKREKEVFEDLGMPYTAYEDFQKLYKSGRKL